MAVWLQVIGGNAGEQIQQFYPAARDAIADT